MKSEKSGDVRGGGIGYTNCVTSIPFKAEPEVVGRGKSGGTPLKRKKDKMHKQRRAPCTSAGLA